MFETLRLTRTLYNAGLEQRREAYRKQGKTVTAYDQQRELTALKAECPEYGAVYSHVLQDALDRSRIIFINGNCISSCQSGASSLCRHPQDQL